jgi:hypothetical protein
MSDEIGIPFTTIAGGFPSFPHSKRRLPMPARRGGR